jgi:hypothetical protein
VRYIEYSDGSFSVRKPHPQCLGVLGPSTRAEVGDTVIVHFRNMSQRGSFGMHPHGFRLHLIITSISVHELNY